MREKEEGECEFVALLCAQRGTGQMPRGQDAVAGKHRVQTEEAAGCPLLH